MATKRVFRPELKPKPTYKLRLEKSGEFGDSWELGMSARDEPLYCLNIQICAGSEYQFPLWIQKVKRTA